MQYDTTLAQAAYDLAAKWDQSRSTSDLQFKESDLEGFNSNQIVVFLETLTSKYPPLPSSHLIYLAEAYKVSKTHNAEIRLRFYHLIFVEPTSEASKKFAPEAADWVTGSGSGIVIGRMKFCRDVFRDVYKVDQELAVSEFTKAKESFHPIARKMIEKVSVYTMSVGAFSR